MSTPTVNRMVDKFRKAAIAEARARRAHDELSVETRKLSHEELADYVEKTDAIDDAVAQSELDADTFGWASKTRDLRLRAAANVAGKDTARGARV